MGARFLSGLYVRDLCPLNILDNVAFCFTKHITADWFKAYMLKLVPKLPEVVLNIILEFMMEDFQSVKGINGLLTGLLEKESPPYVPEDCFLMKLLTCYFDKISSGEKWENSYTRIEVMPKWKTIRNSEKITDTKLLKGYFAEPLTKTRAAMFT